MHITEYQIALRLFLACVFGGIVGFERERNDSPAGFRTHILVSLGSALIMVLSM
ncbi:MAG TPA: MgtC/SapB family protein, partial [Desulfosporosinus sp.]|nr:MgtC/SapB family protein [Desulfosporosinus sp.]